MDAQFATRLDWNITRPHKPALLVAMLILVVAALAAAVTMSAGLSTKNPASAASSWLVDPGYLEFRRAETGERSTRSTSYPRRPVIDPGYLEFRRAETGERSTRSTSYPPRPVIDPRDVKHVGTGGP